MQAYEKLGEAVVDVTRPAFLGIAEWEAGQVEEMGFELAATYLQDFGYEVMEGTSSSSRARASGTRRALRTRASTSTPSIARTSISWRTSAWPRRASCVRRPFRRGRAGGRQRGDQAHRLRQA